MIAQLLTLGQLLLLLPLVSAVEKEIPQTKLRGVVKEEDPNTRVYCPENAPCTIMFVADMDSNSRLPDMGRRVKFESRLMKVRLTGYPGDETSNGLPIYKTKFLSMEPIFGLLNEGGRGLELSEMAVFNGKIYTADDRTGVVYEIEAVDNNNKHVLSPRYIFNEGDGKATGKGHKIEWMTIKNGVLYLGSFGKEFATNDGKILGRSQEWVMTVDEEGRPGREDWHDKYYAMRNVCGATFPGYLTHEAVQWSDVLKKWIALPRKFSTEPYNDELDEQRGTNIFIICDEKFENCEKREAKFTKHLPSHGFSSFAFVPGSDDKVIFSIMSHEVGSEQQTYMYMLGIDGTPLLQAEPLSINTKYEGLVFLP